MAPHPPSGTHHRGTKTLCTSIRQESSDFISGYSAPGKEKVVQHLYEDKDLKDNRAKAPYVKESFECGWEANVNMPNIWLPDGVLPGFKEACMEFYWVRAFPRLAISGHGRAQRLL